VVLAIPSKELGCDVVDALLGAARLGRRRGRGGDGDEGKVVVGEWRVALRGTVGVKSAEARPWKRSARARARMGIQWTPRSRCDHGTPVCGPAQGMKGANPSVPRHIQQKTIPRADGGAKTCGGR
jgi:hypothetical protein